MKKKYQPPRVHKVILDIQQALLAGCKKTVVGGKGSTKKRCNQAPCTSAIGT